jgi:hypothetical protein
MKSKLLNIMIAVMALVGVVQLALSQFHIATITKLFTRQVGFYLFFFILTGLVLSFSLTGLKEKKNLLSVGIILALNLLSAGIYIKMLFNDLNTHANLSFADIKVSFIAVVVGIVISVVSYAIIFYLMKILKIEGDPFKDED